ncbi:MAG: preprotein translocase subunit YajC [Bacteroidota bacterium]
MEGLPILLLQVEGPSLLNNMLPFLLIIVVMYFFFIRPQNQKQKAQVKFVDDMGKGDEVITTSGIFGKITKLDGDIITLEVSPKTYIRVVRSAISKELTEETLKKGK